MFKAQVKFVSWGKLYDFSSDLPKLKIANQVIVETEFGLELGRVESLVEADKVALQDLKSIIRKASQEDLKQVPSVQKKKEALVFCREMIKKHKLEMKLVDVHFSWEGQRLNFAFIADGRIDFRDLVKDLSKHFNSSIRLTQIGTRDEARINGDCGSCGLTLCCRSCLKNFCSITSEMAETQQVVNRGSDRISGMCGRLKCCLSFEYEGYKFLDGKLPPIGTKVNIDGSRGVIINRHILKQTVDVRLPSKNSEDRDTIIEVDINRHRS